MTYNLCSVSNYICVIICTLQESFQWSGSSITVMTGRWVRLIIQGISAATDGITGKNQFQSMWMSTWVVLGWTVTFSRIFSLMTEGIKPKHNEKQSRSCLHFSMKPTSFFFFICCWFFAASVAAVEWYAMPHEWDVGSTLKLWWYVNIKIMAVFKDLECSPVIQYLSHFLWLDTMDAEIHLPSAKNLEPWKM